MNTVPTLSDTKRRFYTKYARPITSIYRRFLEELMVEMHLLWVNTTFIYDPIYALGVVSTFDRFMEGYEPKQEQSKIFEALCSAMDADAEQYRKDAQAFLEVAQGLSIENLQDALTDSATAPKVASIFKAIADNKTFKYSRLFAIGLTQILGSANAELLQDKEGLQNILSLFAEALGLPVEKMKRDVELYLSNLEKMGQARLLMAEMVETERKRREQREKEKQAKLEGHDLEATTSEDSSQTEEEPKVTESEAGSSNS